MSFIRPEAQAALWRWREILAAGLLLLLGLRWALGSAGLVIWVGWGLVALAIGLAVIGAQRLRFRLGVGGPGVVQVDEGQIGYFGPLTGGAVALSELDLLALDHTAKPPHWVLQQSGQPPLHIPVNASGSDALFDAFASLPGLKTERMLTELRRPGPHQVVIWQRQVELNTTYRLH